MGARTQIRAEYTGVRGRTHGRVDTAERAPRAAPPVQTGAMDRSRLDRWNRYRFSTVWDLDAPPARVYSVLEQAGDYPRWWPQVRAVEQIDGQGDHVGYNGTLLIRSLLPYEIRMTATELLRDPGLGLLEAALHGDIEGWARWTVRARRGAGGRGPGPCTSRRSRCAAPC